MIFGTASYMGYKIATGQFPGRSKPLTEAQALELVIALGITAAIALTLFGLGYLYEKRKRKKQ